MVVVEKTSRIVVVVVVYVVEVVYVDVVTGVCRCVSLPVGPAGLECWVEFPTAVARQAPRFL